MRRGEGNAINFYSNYQEARETDPLFPRDDDDAELDGGGGLMAFISRNPWSVSLSLVAGMFVMAIVLFVHIESHNNGPIIVTTADSNFGSRPHIIFLLADDLGWNSLGYQNFDLGEVSPTLTQLAQEGIILDSYYAQEVCSPSRGALMTGCFSMPHFRSEKR